MLPLYPDSIRSLIQENRSLYDIGLHGPDILFYYKALHSNPVNAIGYQMHSRPGAAFFAPAKDIWRQYQTDTPQASQHTAYLLGFVCHYVLDHYCHGHVEKMVSVSGLSHTEIETEFDRFLLLRDGKDPLRAHLASHIHATRENARIIAHFFPTLGQEEILRSLTSMVRDRELLRAPCAAKRSLLFSALKLTGNYESMHGMIMAKNSNPACRVSNLALFKRLKEALAQCQLLTQEYLCYLNEDRPLGIHFQPIFSAAPGWEAISLEI